MELAQTHRQKQRIKSEQTNKDSQQRQMRILRHQSGTQSLAGIDQRIHEHDFLHDGKIVQRAPGIDRCSRKRSSARVQAKTSSRCAFARRCSQGPDRRTRENSATSSATIAKRIGRCRLKSTPGRSSSHAAGMTMSPAASACNVPATTFSIATQEMSIGASKRSSISRVN